MSDAGYLVCSRNEAAAAESVETAGFESESAPEPGSGFHMGVPRQHRLSAWNWGLCGWRW